MPDHDAVLRLEDRTSITTDVLETILRGKGRLRDGARLVELTADVVPASGLVGDVARVRLRYDLTDADGPRSLIVKSPSATFDDTYGLGAVEARFYDGPLSETPSIRAPMVYHCGLDEQSGRTCLILEDVGGDGFVRQIDGCSIEQTLLAVRRLTGLHAHWWHDTQSERLDWIRTPGDAGIGRFCRHWFQSYTGPWPDVLGDLPSHLCERWDDVTALLGSGPSTIVHGDFHCGNVSFADTDCTFIDFQFVQRASGMYDVARFLVTSLTTDTRRAGEGDVLEAYHAGMRAAGVRDYDFATCVDQFRAALLWNVTTPLALHVMWIMTLGTKWPPRLPIVERCLAAIDDWDARRVIA